MNNIKEKITLIPGREVDTEYIIWTQGKYDLFNKIFRIMIRIRESDWFSFNLKLGPEFPWQVEEKVNENVNK